jgi:hypothetical protein
MNTLEYLITPLRLLLWPVRAALSPVLGHALNALLLLTLVAALLYAATAQLRSVFPLVATTALFPLRAVSTPTCLIANVGCSLSLLRGQDGRAQPFWRLFGHDGHVDVAAVSRSLSSEVRVAKDIFDSLVSLGDGRMMEGLAHIR